MAEEDVYFNESSSDYGLKPSDLRDPKKVEFVSQLAQKMWKIHKSASMNDDISAKLLKILSPPEDSDYNGYKNLKSKKKNIFSSSSFYSPSLHPTVEDQINLARNISQSLSDIGNRQSRGQSMYVNRKKRSSKWVHEGLPRSASETFETNYECNDNSGHHHDKPFLELIMDPRGHVQDMNSLKRQGIPVQHSTISPKVCMEIVKDLNTPSGKGAELFAKRRKKSEKWIIDETIGTNKDTEDSNQESFKIEENGDQITQNPIYEEIEFSKPAIQQENIPEKYHPKTYEFLQRIPTVDHSSNSNNFNTAPRGWDENLTVYHPIKFENCNEAQHLGHLKSPTMTYHHLLYTDY